MRIAADGAARRGFLVAVEGVDGAGKHTLTRALIAALERRGRTVYAASFPRYGTVHADLAAAALHGRMGDLVDSVEGMATLFALDRAAAAPDIHAALRRGEVVLCDRWVASNAAYSCARRAESPGISARDGVVAWVGDLEFRRLGLPVPGLTIFLDTPTGLARSRAEGRAATDTSRARDAYERDGELQARTAACYRGLAEAGWCGRWLVAGPDADPDGLVAEILRAAAGPGLDTPAPTGG